MQKKHLAQINVIRKATWIQLLIWCKFFYWYRFFLTNLYISLVGTQTSFRFGELKTEIFPAPVTFVEVPIFFFLMPSRIDKRLDLCHYAVENKGTNAMKTK